MTQYISKAAVVAEINRVLNSYDPNEITSGRYALVELRNFIDTLEVKEMDLEKEIKEDWLFADKTEVDCLECMCLTDEMFVSLAKKYFELGLKAAQKGE